MSKKPPPPAPRPLPHRGLFITLEGPEGSGKSTQVRALAASLRRHGRQVVTLREPGDTPLGERVRRLLLSPSTGAISPRADAFLYMTARAQLVEAVIKPALSRGAVVICDRFLDATLAYQGYGSGLDVEALRCIGDFATQGIHPGVTILLDLPPADGLRRIRGGKDRIERRAAAFHQRVRRGYLALARREPRRFRIVDARRSRNLIAQEIHAAVAELLRHRRSSR